MSTYSTPCNIDTITSHSYHNISPIRFSQLTHSTRYTIVSFFSSQNIHSIPFTFPRYTPTLSSSLPLINLHYTYTHNFLISCIYTVHTSRSVIPHHLLLQTTPQTDANTYKHHYIEIQNTHMHTITPYYTPPCTPTRCQPYQDQYITTSIEAPHPYLLSLFITNTYELTTTGKRRDLLTVLLRLNQRVGVVATPPGSCSSPPIDCCFILPVNPPEFSIATRKRLLPCVLGDTFDTEAPLRICLCLLLSFAISEF